MLRYSTGFTDSYSSKK